VWNTNLHNLNVSKTYQPIPILSMVWEGKLNFHVILGTLRRLDILQAVRRGVPVKVFSCGGVSDLHM
jgi:hypothetical protein